MDEKISIRAIEQYSNSFASKLASTFFQKKEKITGPEILALCEIKQVNLLVIKELMDRWNRESEKWKSTFFDYEAPEVKQAMAQFKNTLSNQIAVSKTDFLPLLETAVSKTLFLLLAPYDFYSNVLDLKGKGLLKVEELKNETRYLKINKAPLEKLVEKLEQKKADLITGNEAFAMLDHILEEVNFTPEDIESYVAAFSKWVPLNLDELLEAHVAMKTPPLPQEPASASAPISTPVASSKNEFRIKDSLTVNQKFMFTKILFFGDFEIFSEAIDRFDQFDNLGQAIKHIEENYPQWDRESEEYEEFFAVVQRKFSRQA